MDPSLQARREAAADRHDAAMRRSPRREGAEFQRELEAVIAELTAVEAALERAVPPDPVERARTLSWLGSAYFDLGRGLDPNLLSESARCYLVAEEILGEEDAPLLKAKIDFNFANTLRGQSSGSNVALLETAEHRYSQARAVFKMLGQPALVKQADECLRSLGPQLGLAREHSKLGRELSSLQDLSERVPAADALERDGVRARLAEIRKRPHDSLNARLDEGFGELRRLVAERPDLFQRESAAVADLGQRVQALKDQITNSATAEPEAAPSTDAILTALMGRLASDLERGVVSPDRAPALRELLMRFGEVMSLRADDLEGLQRRSTRLRELMQRAITFALHPSEALPAPPPKSREAWLEELIGELRRRLLSESTRAGGADTELFLDVAKFGAALREASGDEARVNALEPVLWSFAERLRRRQRIANVSLAKPRWPDRPVQNSPKSVFVSGAVERRFLDELRRRGHTLSTEPKLGNYADERWTELRASSVGLFWLGSAPGEGAPDPDQQREPRAQTCYDLGCALALGMPVVVLLGPGSSLPFDVPVRVQLVDSATPVEGIVDAVESAAFNPPWGQQAAQTNEGRERVLETLRTSYGLPNAGGTLEIAWRSLAASETNADFVDRLTRLVTMLPGRTPELLFPAWPASYPRIRNVFYITPFRDWSEAPSRWLARNCEARQIGYARGDSSAQQRILYAIWAQITSASAVVADMTELNPNVALELGVAHAFGKKSLLIYNRDLDGDGRRELRLFESVKQDRVHAYSATDAFAKTQAVLEAFLGELDSD
jgi:hypothetical protein